MVPRQASTDVTFVLVRNMTAAEESASSLKVQLMGGGGTSGVKKDSQVRIMWSVWWCHYQCCHFSSRTRMSHMRCCRQSWRAAQPPAERKCWRYDSLYPGSCSNWYLYRSTRHLWCFTVDSYWLVCLASGRAVTVPWIVVCWEGSVSCSCSAC